MSEIKRNNTESRTYHKKGDKQLLLISALTFLNKKNPGLAEHKNLKHSNSLQLYSFKKGKEIFTKHYHMSMTEHKLNKKTKQKEVIFQSFFCIKAH